MKKNIKKEDKLRVYWDDREDDVMIYHPMGTNTSADGWYLHNNVFTMEFIEEIKRRGYDIRSIKFEISPKLPNKRFACMHKKYGYEE